MRVVLVGRPSDRDRLRQDLLAAGLEVVAEATTVAAARELDADHDAIVLAPAAAPPDDAPPAVESLTSREREVLQLLALGLANKAIAERLEISDQTVKFHVGQILGKLGAANRTDAVRRAVRRGLIDL